MSRKHPIGGLTRRTTRPTIGQSVWDQTIVCPENAVDGAKWNGPRAAANPHLPDSFVVVRLLDGSRDVFSFAVIPD